MRISTLLLLLFLMVGSLSAQDKHFTQFYAAPLNLNPALSGAFQGRYRVSAIYRDQWRGALDNPFVTFSAALDLRFPIGRGFKKDAVSGGILFFTDRVGGVDFNTNQMAFFGAYHKSLDQKSTQYLSAGIKLGISQRNVNYETYQFQDQFNGVSGYTLPSTEILPANNFSFGDFSVGVHYTASPNNNNTYYAGIALHHFNASNISFYTDDLGTVHRLYLKVQGSLGASFPISDRTSIIPRVMVAWQGPHLEIDLGTNFRLALNDYNDIALHLGTWVRPVSYDETGFNIDAIVLLAGLEYDGIVVGMSYDFNMNSIVNYSKVQGAFEISVGYTGQYEDETILCPTF